MADDAELIDSPGARLIIFIALFTPFLIVVVGLRFYARSLTQSQYDAGDVLILAALLSQLVLSGIALGAAIEAGVGIHVEVLASADPVKIIHFFKYLLALSIWYFATITISKLAVCKLYRTLFPGRTVTIVINITAAVLILTPIILVAALLGACRPFSANWGPEEFQKVYCSLDKPAIFVYGTIPNIVTDIVLLAVPLPIVWRLHAPTKLKVGLTLIFVMGSFGLEASILRFKIFRDANFEDPTYGAAQLIMWTLIEPGAYLIAACLLMFRPLLDKCKTGRLVKRVRSFVGRSFRGGGRGASGHRRDGEGDCELLESGGISTTVVSGGTQGGYGPSRVMEKDRDDHREEGGILVTRDIQQVWDQV